MTNPTRTRRRFTAQQKSEAVELCLQEGLSCNAVAERLGLPSSSLARWVRQARIDRGQAAWLLVLWLSSLHLYGRSTSDHDKYFFD